ncbi:MAG TPA: AAA family ATPase, partial [Saprospiraceae bacterium]|nr:AAA family ATPase [Saprospiraceae bacterium]
CLQADLEHCLQQWESTGQIADFDIAAQDVSLRFRIPQKLYGREKERAELLAAFERAAIGRKQLTLVGGWSGAGKTALVADVHVPLTERNGLYISGKFEQYQRNIPYLAWRQAFDQLTELLLTEGQGVIAQWRKRIVDTLGDLTGVVTSLVPSLEKILGPQPMPPELPPTEVQNRFNYAVRTFMRAICVRQHPLVIFLDDLQWADAASLNLLRLVMTEPGLGYLMVIGAYRENEVSEGHPLGQAIENLHKEWLAINETDTSTAFAPDNHLVSRLSIGPLDEADLSDLLKDTLDISPQQTAELSEIIFQKTRGNAYFVHRFLESLHQEGHIRLETQGQQTKWAFRAADIRTLRITDNVADLLTRKVSKLPLATRQLLATAACLGHSFDLGTLAIISRLPPHAAEASLWEAVEEGLLNPLYSEYRFFSSLPASELAAVRFAFAHDRVRQTIYDALPEGEKHHIHQQAALLLLDTLPEAEQAERVFELANHLNAAGDDQAHLMALRAHYNYEAGKKAKASAAYEPAFNFSQKALHALPADAWASDYARTHQYH